MDALTKRNHSNPCFWTAYWNEAYYEARITGCGEELEARKQPILALNVRANKIIPTIVDEVHVDKGMGVANIEPQSMKAFCKRHFPDRYEKFCREIDEHPDALLLDFENVFTGIEATPAYRTLHKVIEQQGLAGPEDKCNIACFIVLQQMRSHAILKSMIEAFEMVGIDKWEYFWMLKQCLGDRDSLFRMVNPIAISQWIVYRAVSHMFPLPDSPVLVNDGHIMVAISPRMLVEVNLRVRTSECSWIDKQGVHKSKLREYRRRAISNTFKELIFHDPDILRSWQETPEFRKRVSLIADAESYNTLVALDEKRQLLHINALGNAL